jgi:RNA polymerase sigma-70 factor (ECF subfamily)
LESVYRTHYATLFRFVFARVRQRELTSDLVQDVFVKAIPSLSRDKGYVDALPLLYTIARNTLIDHYRRKKAIPTSQEDLDAAEAGDRSDALALQYERKRVIERALDMLPEEQRTVITLLYVEELRTDEVATLLGKKEEAIRQIKSRAQKRLRAFLQTHE